ncbi:MAG: ABC transporter ATP-binding protein [Candidatus Geothermarchaeales archaeon]
MVTVLELENVNVFLSGVQILRDVSLKVEEGETVCLVGRNGAGKTTTIKGIMGFYPVQSGKILFKGQDIVNLSPDEKAKLGLGYSPEDSALFPGLTVEQNLNIAFWHTKSKTPREVVEKRIFDAFTELKPLLARRSLFLSGGEKKMLAVSRALALDPSILLLDEPLEGLAPVAVARFAGGLEKIHEMGISMLVAESNIALAEKLANRLYAIDRGEIIYEGDPKKVYEDEEVMRTIRGY